MDVLIENKKNEKQNQNMKKLEASDLIELIKCKANYASDGMISQARKILEGISRYISSFAVDSVQKEGFK